MCVTVSVMLQEKCETEQLKRTTDTVHSHLSMLRKVKRYMNN
jgi:hypothetical protein